MKKSPRIYTIPYKTDSTAPYKSPTGYRDIKQCYTFLLRFIYIFCGFKKNWHNRHGSIQSFVIYKDTMNKEQSNQKLVHWADQTAEKIIRERGELESYTCASGITPSGTVHIGNFREII